MNLQQLFEKFYILEDQNLFEAVTTTEADKQLASLDLKYRKKIVTAIEMFCKVGTKYKNLNVLDETLYELKPEGVRAYFSYHPTKRKIIIVGFICLKKTQKAPEQFIEQAHRNIDNYLKEEQNG